MSTQGNYTIPEFSTGDRFRKARELTGLDQREFAERIGANKNTVYNYEQDEPRRHVKAIVAAWSLATGVPVQWLLEGTDPAPTTGNQSSGCIEDLVA